MRYPQQIWYSTSSERPQQAPPLYSTSQNCTKCSVRATCCVANLGLARPKLDVVEIDRRTRLRRNLGATFNTELVFDIIFTLRPQV